MTSRILSLAFIAALISSSVGSSSGVEASTKLPPGIYKIVNSASGTWARNFPGPGHQGPWISPITLATHFSNIYQTWEVTPYEEGYRILNHGSRNSAFAQQGTSVYGFSDGFTKWYIEPAGGNEYRIHYPNKDLIWTIKSDGFLQDVVVLEPAKGGENQVFRFDKA